MGTKVPVTHSCRLGLQQSEPDRLPARLSVCLCQYGDDVVDDDTYAGAHRLHTADRL